MSRPIFCNSGMCAYEPLAVVPGERYCEAHMPKHPGYVDSLECGECGNMRGSLHAVRCSQSPESLAAAPKGAIPLLMSRKRQYAGCQPGGIAYFCDACGHTGELTASHFDPVGRDADFDCAYCGRFVRTWNP